MFAKFFFLYCGFVITFCGLAAVHLRNPVHCVLGVLVLFFHMAGLYLLLNAEFLAAVQVIVYAGAILVLYLFVLFLVDIRKELLLPRYVDSRFAAGAFAVGLLVCLLSILRSFVSGPHGSWSIAAVSRVTHTRALGQEIYSSYILPFEIVALILLIAVIGGMVLARRDSAVSGEGKRPEEEK